MGLETENKIGWALPPHCGRCGSLLVDRYCGQCGAAIPPLPSATDAQAWLLLPRHKEGRNRQLEEQFGQCPGYREDEVQDDIFHALPLLGEGWEKGSLGILLPNLLSWNGAAIKTYSGRLFAGGTEPFNLYAAFIKDGLPGKFSTTNSPLLLKIENLLLRYHEVMEAEELLALVMQIIRAMTTEEQQLLLTPPGGMILQKVLSLVGMGLTDLAKYLSPTPCLFHGNRQGMVGIKAASSLLSSRVTPWHLPSTPRKLFVISPDSLLFQNDDQEWFFTGPNGIFPISFPGELEAVYSFIDATAILAVRTATGTIPFLLRAPLPTVKQTNDSSPYHLLAVSQNEPFTFTFDVLNGQLWVLYQGGQLSLYTWSNKRHTFLAQRSWQIAGMKAAQSHRHQLLNEQFVDLAPHFLLTREREHFNLYSFYNRQVRQAVIPLTLITPKLLAGTAEESVYLLDKSIMYELYIKNNQVHFTENILPGEVQNWAVNGNCLWLAGTDWFLRYHPQDGAAAIELKSSNETLFMTAMGPLVCPRKGHLRQYLPQAHELLPLPPWPQRENEGKLLKAWTLPPSEMLWNKQLINIIADRDLSGLLAFCVSTIDRSAGLIMERRVYLMMQEIEKRRWYVASKAVSNYYTDRSSMPNMYLSLSLVLHQYLWQGDRERLRQQVTALATEYSTAQPVMMLDKLAQLYLFLAQELWQNGYDLAEELQKQVAQEPTLYDFLLPEVESWFEVVSALAYGDNLRPVAPEEWFICRLAAILRTISEAHLGPLIKECGGWLTRVRNV